MSSHECPAAVEAGSMNPFARCVPEKDGGAATEQLVASDFIDPCNLRRLLESVVAEDCAHSWRNAGPDQTLEGLLGWENRLRPTRVFFFSLKRGGQSRLVGAAAVAERLTQDFPHRGFCVLARCFILPEYRGQGLYRRILHYRLEHCKALFGDQLNAVHLGSVNERVTQVISNHGIPGWPNFIHLGEEELWLAGHVHLVGAYMLLVRSFVEKLEGALWGPDAPAAIIELRQALSRIGSADVRNWGMLIKRASEEGRSLGWFGTREPRELSQLLQFCEAIPLVGFR
jgi:GNAT superfamily N-acetyltransferase